MEALNQIEGRVDEVLAKFRESAELVKTWERLMELFGEHSALMWEAVMKSDHVGVHMCNRGGVGLVTSKAIANAEQHCDAGFSYVKACAGAVQFQPPPNENEHKRFNVEICSSDRNPALVTIAWDVHRSVTCELFPSARSWRQ